MLYKFILVVHHLATPLKPHTKIYIFWLSWTYIYIILVILSIPSSLK